MAARLEAKILPLHNEELLLLFLIRTKDPF